jgi:hypothetical protein
MGSGTHSDPKFDQRVGNVSYIDARKKSFRNAVSLCVLLRKNFRNGVASRSVTKMLLVISKNNLACSALIYMSTCTY